MEREKKIFSFENLYQLLTEPTIDIKRKLVYAGNNLANLNTKSDAELRLMLFNYVKMDPNDIVKVNSFDKNKLTLLASKMGISINELYSKLNVPIEEKKEIESKEENIYLYKTEKLFDSALSEYLTSDKPNYEKAEEYVKRVNFIEKEFRNAVRTTNRFAGSDRYKQVIEYIKKIPMFEEFKNDENLGDYINQVNKKKYYENISNQLEEYISKLTEEMRKYMETMESMKYIDEITATENNSTKLGI